jgi:hypothetical protein
MATDGKISWHSIGEICQNFEYSDNRNGVETEFLCNETSTKHDSLKDLKCDTAELKNFLNIAKRQWVAEIMSSEINKL